MKESTAFAETTLNNRESINVNLEELWKVKSEN